jgi:ATP phosphoribosyltransferase
MKIRIAVQKSGRLGEGSQKMITDCGISLNNGFGRLKAEASNFPLEVLYLRDDDIPQYVADGVADIGIAGENVIREKNIPLEMLARLGFGKCRLSIAIPRNNPFSGLKDLQGMSIATSYPVILGEFLKGNGISSQIHEISGSVEIAPGIGLAEAVCDLVSSGSTLLTNGLKEVYTVLHSEAILIGRSGLCEEKQSLVSRFLLRINAVNRARNNKYILLNAPDEKLPEICNLIPGMKSPTILPLAAKGWSSVHSVVNEDEFWDIIENLKRNGAQGILVVPIEKMVQ